MVYVVNSMCKSSNVVNMHINPIPLACSIFFSPFRALASVSLKTDAKSKFDDFIQCTPASKSLKVKYLTFSYSKTKSFAKFGEAL